MTTIDRTMGLTEWALLLALSLLWGGSFFFVGVAVEELGALTIVALRVGLVALALHVLILLLVTFLIPASAIVLGVFVLGERLEWRHLAGMGLIGLGLAAIDGRPLGGIRKMAYAYWKARREGAGR